MLVRVLGPVEVLDAGVSRPLPGKAPTVVLAMLAAREGAVVPAGELIEALWGDAATTASSATLQSHIARIRRALGSDAVVTAGQGYRLGLPGGAVDAVLFERSLSRAAALFVPSERARELRSALELWRGPTAYAGLEDCPPLALEATRLGELRLGAQQARIAADLERGATRGLVAELATLTDEHPTHEGLWALTVDTLAASGRTAEALEAYRVARARLRNELGLDPGPTLRAAQRRALARPPAASSEVTETGRREAPERRRVTVVVTRSPAAEDCDDPEDHTALVAILRGQVTEAAAALDAEVHHGEPITVSFGAVRSHDDDARRAVLLAEGLAAHGHAVGVATGVVIAGPDGPRGRVLQSAAALAVTPGHAAIDATTSAALETHLQTVAPRPRLLGREKELRRLRGLLRDVVRDRRAAMCVVTAEPGVGKSALVAAWGDASTEATFSYAQCDAYGERSALAPLADVVPTRTAEAGAALTLRAEVVAHWSTALAALATEGPHVLVVEDAHWASDLLLEVLESVAAHPPPVPLLLVVTARPEVAQRRTGWPDPPGVTPFRLAELGADATAELVSALLPDAAPADREALVRASDGVPLFTVEYASMSATASRGPAPVPTRLVDVVEARLDTLPAGTRALLGRAAVLGSSFASSALAVVGEYDDGYVRAAVEELLRRRFLHAAEAPAPLPAYRFSHDLVRDAAYGRLLRADRAALHLATARWWAAQPEPAVDIVAEHAWTAHELAGQAGLEQLATESKALAVEAVVQAGSKARGVDTLAAVTLLERAASLLRGTDREAVAETDFAEALIEHREFERASDHLARAIRIFGRSLHPGRVDAAIVQTQADFALGAAGAHESLLHEILEDFGPGPERARARSCLAVLQILRQTTDAFRRCVELADEAIAEAENAGCPHAALLAYPARGRALVALGDERGLADMEYFQKHGPEHEKPFFVLGARQWFAGAAHHWSGPETELRLRHELEAYAERTGMTFLVSFGVAERLRCLWELGRFAECVAEADTVEVGSDAMTRWVVVQRALALRDLGALDAESLADVVATPPADESDLRHVIGCAWLRARVAADAGDHDAAVGLLDGLGDLAAYARRDGAVEFLPRVLRLRRELGVPVEPATFEGLELPPTPLGRALADSIAGLTAADPGDARWHLEAAVERWSRLGPSVDLDLARADLAAHH